jgi:hypothetical protein
MYGSLVLVGAFYMIGMHCSFVMEHDTDKVASRLVTAAVVLCFPGMNIPPVLIRVHHGLHNEDPNQVESLPSPHQMMAHGCLVDMVPMIHQICQGTLGSYSGHDCFWYGYTIYF